MFIFIYEDGDMSLEQQVTDGDLAMADDGVLDIIDVSKANKPMRYDAGEMHEMRRNGA